MKDLKKKVRINWNYNNEELIKVKTRGSFEIVSLSCLFNNPNLQLCVVVIPWEALIGYNLSTIIKFLITSSMTNNQSIPKISC